MQRALLELLLLAVPAGLLGSWIVLRRTAFFAHAVGTATFPGLVPWGGGTSTGWTLFVYSWLVLCVPMAFLVRRLERSRWGHRLAPLGLYLVGFGPMMCAITVDAYLKEFRGAAMTWDKTEKTGRVTV